MFLNPTNLKNAYNCYTDFKKSIFDTNEKTISFTKESDFWIALKTDLHQHANLSPRESAIYKIVEGQSYFSGSCNGLAAGIALGSSGSLIAIFFSKSIKNIYFLAVNSASRNWTTIALLTSQVGLCCLSCKIFHEADDLNSRFNLKHISQFYQAYKNSENPLKTSEPRLPSSW